MARFLDDAENLLVLQSINDDVIARAIDVTEEFALRPGDAVQLATALIVKETIPDEKFVLLVSDRELYEAGLAAGIDTIDPENPDASALLRRARATP